MPTLFCPTCGYNLTGLPENRCPECGSAFDPVALGAVPPGHPITVGQTIFRLALPPGIFLVSLLALIPKNGDFVAIPMIVGTLMFIASIINAIILSKRIMYTINPNPSIARARARRFFFLPVSAFGLFCCQLLIAAAGCAIAAATM